MVLLRDLRQKIKHKEINHKSMKNIYKSKVAKAYHRHNLLYKLEYRLFIIPYLITILVIIPIIGGIRANENISESQFAIMYASVLSIAILVEIIPGLYNDSYTETELSDYPSFARKIFCQAKQTRV